jgi:glycosyltransferase involved in cell wall biosynthesis
MLPKGNSIFIIPHGNYIPFVKKLPPISNEYKTTNTLKLLFFGQIKKVKGLEILIKALAIVNKKFKNVTLTIAGNIWHDDITYYKNLITDLNLSENITTHFKYIEEIDAIQLFKDSDMIVLPYKKIYQSGVLLLSMSYGRACLCSDLDAFNEIVLNNETGYIFENNNIDSLSKKILEIYQKRFEISRIEDNAQELLKTKFNWDTISKLTKELYSF